MMSSIKQRLEATGKPYITIADLLRAGAFAGVTPQAVYLRLAQLPEGQRPEDFGAFKAGGCITWAGADQAARFAEHHEAYWAMRFPNRKQS